MVEIRFPPPAGNRFTLSVQGHAGSGPKGFDIVCSAVSGLVLTLLGGLETEVGAEIQGTVKEGFCDVSVGVPSNRSDVFCLIARVFRYGFFRLAESYPEHVRIISS